MANPNIFAQYARPAKSVTDYMTEMDDADAARSRNALMALTLGQQTEEAGYKRQDRARADAERNKLAALVNQFGGINDALIGAAERDPDLIGWADARKAAELERRKKAADAAKTEGETVESRAKLYRGLIGRVGSYDGALSWVRAQYEDPIIGPIVSKAMPLEAALGEIPRDPQGLRQWQMREGMDLDKFIAATAPKFTAAGDRLVNTNPDAVAQPIPINQSPDSRAADARAREQLKLSRERLAWEMGGGGQVPEDQTQALLTKRFGKAPPGYRWTQSGDQERIPGGPADAKAQAANESKAGGAAQVNETIASLRDAYDRLEKGGGITSTNKSARENLAAAAGSSGAGQAVGRALGTKNQSARNDITMARPALLAALMKATGMSAKQMDSNAELKLWLATATDPTLDVESNRRALDAIERKYLTPLMDAPAGGPPPGVDQRLWDAMTPQERSLWKK